MQELARIMACINPTSRTVALGFDLAQSKLRNCYLGLDHVNSDMALFDGLLREVFEGEGATVCRAGGDEWLAFWEGEGAETLVQAVAGSYVEMTPFTWEWAYTAQSGNGEERVAKVTGQGLIERAFRCGMVRLVPGEEAGAQVERMMDRIFTAPVNSAFWLDSTDTKRGRSQDARLEWLSVSELLCPFCEMPVPHEGRPACVDTVCTKCQACIEADFQFA